MIVSPVTYMDGKARASNFRNIQEKHNDRKTRGITHAHAHMHGCQMARERDGIFVTLGTSRKCYFTFSFNHNGLCINILSHLVQLEQCLGCLGSFGGRCSVLRLATIAPATWHRDPLQDFSTLLPGT